MTTALTIVGLVSLVVLAVALVKWRQQGMSEYEHAQEAARQRLRRPGWHIDEKERRRR